MQQSEGSSACDGGLDGRQRQQAGENSRQNSENCDKKTPLREGRTCSTLGSWPQSTRQSRSFSSPCAALVVGGNARRNAPAESPRRIASILFGLMGEGREASLARKRALGCSCSYCSCGAPAPR